MEWKRIFWNRKCFLLFFVLFLTNIALYLLHNSSMLSGMQTQDWEKQYRQERYQYLREYKGRIREIRQREKTLSKFSVFSKRDSFSDKNMKKTAEDYAKISGVKLQYVDDSGILSFLNYKEIKYLLFIFVIWLVFQFGAEQKNGLHTLVYSCPNGRAVLFGKRLLITAAGTAAVSFLFYGSIFFLQRCLYGAVDLQVSAQSLPLLADVTVPCTLPEFLVLFFLIQTLGCICSAFTVWLFASYFRYRGLSVFSLAALYVLGYLLRRYLSIQSVLSILRYTNFFFILDLSELYEVYHNLSIGGEAINIRAVTLLFMAAVLAIQTLLLFICAVWRRPVRAAGLFERSWERLAEWIRRKFSGLPVVFWEIYKMLWCRKGWIVVLFFIWVAMQSEAEVEIAFSPRQEFMNTFYQEREGVLCEDTLKYAEKLEKEIGDFEKAYQETEERYKAGGVSEEEWIRTVGRAQVYEEYYAPGLEELQNRIAYVQSLKEERGIDAWLINDKGYAELLTEMGYKRNTEKGFIYLLCLLVLLSGIVSYEYQTESRSILRITKRGRGWLIWKKILSMGLFVVLLWMAAYSAEWLQINKEYPMRGFQAPVQSLPFLEQFPFPISIGGYLLLLNLGRLLTFWAFGSIIFFLSCLTARTLRTIFAGLICLIPCGIQATGLIEHSLFAFTSYLSNPLYRPQHGRPYLYGLGMLFLLLAGTFSCLAGRKLWEQTEPAHGIAFLRGNGGKHADD